MARQARFTETLGPTKVTPTQEARVDQEAERRRVSVSEVVREALDVRYGLQGGEVPAQA